MTEDKKQKKEPSFWDCKYGIFAGGCRCKLRDGDNECMVEKGGVCGYYEEYEL